MCEAIIDLFRDEYDKGVEEARQLGVQRRFSMTRELAEDTINRLKGQKQ